MKLLIDSCSLLQLVYSQGYSPALIELENYINSGTISLLTHELILQEWESHKPKDKQRKIQKLLGESSKTGAANSSSLLPSQIPITVEHIDLQYQKLDALLRNAYILSTPEIINNEFAKRFREKLAPFHSKRQSQNDWEIIGSAALYCEHNNISILNFVSYNSTDFADPQEPLRTIHPDIQSRFSIVKINYFQEVQHFTNAISERLVPEYLIGGKLIRNKKYSYESSIKKTVLDSLYYLFKDIYEEVSFVPLYQLIKHYPFSEKERSYTHYSVFGVSYVRDNLITLFEAIKISNSNTFQITDEKLFEGIKDYRQKIEYVLKKLSGNLIFNLLGKNNRKRVNIHFAPAGHCTCFKCSFLDLIFLGV